MRAEYPGLDVLNLGVRVCRPRRKGPLRALHGQALHGHPGGARAAVHGPPHEVAAQGRALGCESPQRHGSGVPSWAGSFHSPQCALFCDNKRYSQTHPTCFGLHAGL